MEDGTDIRGVDVGLEASRLFYGNPDSHIRRQLWSVFVQDDWRIHPRVTLNLGLRYDLATVPKDRDLILGSFDPALGIVQEGIQIPSIVTRGDHNDLSPRVGFAWDIRGNGRTVLRAGASMIYSPLGLGAFAEIGNSPGFAGQQTGWIIGCSAPLTAWE
jgi:outer membrane receptor protein involved in Fe transport